MHRSKVVSVLNLRRLVQHSLSVAVLALAVVATLFTSTASAQQLTATLTGTVYDQGGAVVPNATVTLTNEASGDTRDVTSNGSGYFSFPSVQPGSYSVKVTASGFEAWDIKGIVLNQGDARALPNVALKVGQTTMTVEVSSEAAAVAPVDTGEVSHTLNNDMVDNISYVGRDAGELMRIFPGAATAGGGGTGGFNDHSVSSNTGPVGAFSFNGTQPNGAVGYMLDGANLVDPGNAGTQIANINPDMTAEVKMLTNSYDAQYAKGPVLFQAYSKSGGRDFHGEGYMYARNGIFDSIDSLTKAEQAGSTIVKQPEHYYYTGGNIGGPVLLPFVKFNHNRDKLFFWFGYEYMDQLPVGSVDNYVVPTPAMLGGDFSPSSLAALNGSADTGVPNAFAVPCTQTGTTTTNGVTTPNYNGGGCSAANNNFASMIHNGVIPSSLIDPQGLALLSLLPKPNIDPSTSGGWNYRFINPGASGSFLVPTNRWEQTEKVDYAPTDKDKLTVSYVYQKETDLHPIATWWAPSSAVPYPSAMPALTPSSVIMGNYTHVFGPSVVNETVVTYARYVNDLSLANPSAADPGAHGINTAGLFGKTEKQIPDTLSWSGSLPEFQPQADFYSGGNNLFGATKSDPAVYDNLSWVRGSHTMKFGGYWDLNSNVQNIGPVSGGTNGQYEFEPWSGNSTGNVLADELMGNVNSYSQGASGPFATEQFHQISGYAQDSWKIGRKLTLNYGVRLDHIGQYYDPNGPGYIVWDPAIYNNTPSAPANTGLVTNATDSKVPRSGLVSPFAYILPRFGGAYDLFGNGKTVIRGGFAVFKYQMGINTPSGADDTGAFGFSTGSFQGIGNLSGLKAPTGTSYNGGSFTAMPLNLGKVPSTRDYNLTVDQTLPGKSLLEVAYVGTYNYNGILYDGGASGPTNMLNNANFVPIGALLKPDPINGSPGCNPTTGCPNGFNANDYFPLRNYQSINLTGFGSYSNYNGLQTTWQKQAGPVVFFANYTFSKVLGIRDAYSGDGQSSGAMVNTYCLSCNYGTLSYDHRHIFNAAYVVRLPSPVHSNFLGKGVVNGWTISGVTTYQSGQPLQPNFGGNFNVNYPGYMSNSSFLGTEAIVLEPVLTCDPTSGLTGNMRFNPKCFGPPSPGQNGDTIWPNITAPGVFNSDLSIYKTFKFGESARSLQFRADAFNFLNHPNAEFNLDGSNSDIKLNFATASGALSETNTNTGTTGAPKFTTGYRTIEFAAKFYF